MSLREQVHECFEQQESLRRVSGTTPSLAQKLKKSGGLVALSPTEKKKLSVACLINAGDFIQPISKSLCEHFLRKCIVNDRVENRYMRVSGSDWSMKLPKWHALFRNNWYGICRRLRCTCSVSGLHPMYFRHKPSRNPKKSLNICKNL